MLPGPNTKPTPKPFSFSAGLDSTSSPKSWKKFWGSKSTCFIRELLIKPSNSLTRATTPYFQTDYKTTDTYSNFTRNQDLTPDSNHFICNLSLFPASPTVFQTVLAISARTWSVHKCSCWMHSTYSDGTDLIQNPTYATNTECENSSEWLWTGSSSEHIFSKPKPLYEKPLKLTIQQLKLKRFKVVQMIHP